MFEHLSTNRRWLLVLCFNAVALTVAICVFLGLQPDAVDLRGYLSSPKDASADNNNAAAGSGATATATVTVVQTVTAKPSTPTGDTKDWLDTYDFKAQSEPAQRAEYESRCDPYSEPGFFDVTLNITRKTKYVSLNPDCQPRASGELWARVRRGEDIPGLRDKTVVLFGDSVDRELMTYTCDLAGGYVNQTFQDDHDNLWNTTTRPWAPNCFPRICTVPQYNLRMVNYFMYGLDSEGVWSDKSSNFWGPFTWRERFDMFVASYKNTLHRGDSPDVIFFNSGLWDFARIDRIGMRANESETLSYNVTTVNTYRTELAAMVARLREAFPESALVYRESHYPHVVFNGRYSKADRPRQLRYAAQKLDQLNHVAADLMRRARVRFWAMGQLTRGLRKNELFKDDVHPGNLAREIIWGPGFFEYIIRNGKTKK